MTFKLQEISWITDNRRASNTRGIQLILSIYSYWGSWYIKETVAFLGHIHAIAWTMPLSGSPAQWWLLWRFSTVGWIGKHSYKTVCGTVSEPGTSLWQIATNWDVQICSVTGPFKVFVFLCVPPFMSVFPSFWNSFVRFAKLTKFIHSVNILLNLFHFSRFMQIHIHAAAHWS